MATRSTLVACSFALYFASIAIGCDASPNDAVAAPLMIYGIEPGMTRKEVEKTLGKGKESVLEGFVARRVSYPDILVGFDEFGSVVQIESESSEACLLSKVCVGSSLEDIQAELRGGSFSHYMHQGSVVVNGDGCWAEIAIESRTADSIVVKCSP